MKIHADLTDVYGATVFRAAPFADGLRDSDSQLEKSAFKMVTLRVAQCWSGTSKLIFARKKNIEDRHVTIRETCERCDVSIGTAERNVQDDLRLRKMAARWIPHLLTNQQKTETES